MTNKRKQHSAEFKAKVALEAIKGRKTISQIAAEYEVHPNLVTNWKKQLQEAAPHTFEAANKRENADKEIEETLATLYQQIGQMKVEMDFLKKKVGPLS
jgi:transposase-like protein